MLTVCDGALDALVVESTIALLTHLGCPAEALGQQEGVMRSEEGALAAIIGFVGDDLEGALTMMSTPRLLSKTLPESVEGSEDLKLLHDWAAEVANQLLGRLKNKLALHDVNFNVAPPIPMFAQCLTLPPLRRPNATSWSEFVTPYGSLCVRFEALAAPDWVLPPLEHDQEALLQEGDLQLF